MHEVHNWAQSANYLLKLGIRLLLVRHSGSNLVVKKGRSVANMGSTCGIRIG